MNNTEQLNKKEKAVVLCSGGMDSVTLLNLVVKDLGQKHVTILFVDYNQKTLKKEREYSKTSAERLGCRWKEFELDLGSITKTSLIHQNSIQKDLGTEVQGRNSIFLGLAVAFAQTMGYQRVYIGLQSADVVYGDAQPEYFFHMKKAMKLAYGVDLYAPLLENTKEEINCKRNDAAVT